jgi:putative membrane protein
MLLVLCVDLDDDIGRKTGVETPVTGLRSVRDAAVALAETDPEDSDVNVLFEGVHLARTVEDEPVALAAVAGDGRGDVVANRAVGEEVDAVLDTLETTRRVRAVVVTDGAQDESVVPAIRSRVPIDGVRRVVVRQSQDLESMYYTIKQVLDDPETRGAVLVPLGILLLIYPLAVVASLFNAPGGVVIGTVSALLGLYVIARGVGAERRAAELFDRARQGLYAGRVTLVAYVVALVLFAVGAATGAETLGATQADAEGALGALEVVAALLFGSVRWFAAAGLTTSVGQITDEYLDGDLEWRYLNAPFYVVAIASVLHAVGGYFVGALSLQTLAVALTGGTLLGFTSTLAFAVAESRFPREEDGPDRPATTEPAGDRDRERERERERERDAEEAGA